jgi:hypothetical protein
MQLNGQLQKLVDLSVDKVSLVLFRQDAGWSPNAVYMRWYTENRRSPREQSTLLSVQSAATHFTIEIGYPLKFLLCCHIITEFSLPLVSTNQIYMISPSRIHLVIS